MKNLKNLNRHAFRALIVAAHMAAPFAGLHAATAATAPAAPAANAPHKKAGPVISKALDALLLPINKGVIKKFKLKEGSHGVLVLSVRPGGVADKQGIKPGDILAEVQGRKVHKPLDVDIAVYRQLKAGHSNLSFNVSRGGAVVAVAAVITMESYREAISVSEVSSWQVDTEVSSASYEEYVSEESEEIQTSEQTEETEEASVDEGDADDQADDADDASDDDGEDGDDGDDGDGGDDDGE